MKTLLFPILFFTLVILGSCGRQFHFAPSAESDVDTSFVYALPYPKGKAHLLVQGYNSRFSHRGRLGLDFKMKAGSPITAVRSGIVLNLEKSNTEGGPSRKYFSKANFVTVRHEDGSIASYGHLQHNGVVVNKGDLVQQGQVIARSGSTGYSALPHLHFSLFRNTPTGRKPLPARFRTQKGIRYLRVARWYKSK